MLSILFLLQNHPNVFESHQLLRYTSPQNSILNLHITQNMIFSCADPVSPTPSGNCMKIKRVNSKFLFFHSTVFMVFDSSKLPFLNNLFSKKGTRCQFFVFPHSSQGKASKPQQCDHAKKKKTPTLIHVTTQKKRQLRVKI